jgi:hypothetical protein
MTADTLRVSVRLRQSRDDFTVGDTFDAGQVRAELEQRGRRTP